MRLLVCGARKYNDVGRVFRELDRLHAMQPIALLIQGGAAGADACARRWARVYRVPLSTYKAEWTKYGKAAGPIRNQRMLDDGKPTDVIAFPGNDGTADMVARAKAAGIRPIEI